MIAAVPPWAWQTISAGAAPTTWCPPSASRSPRKPEHTALRGLLEAVGPGGTLLIASHDPAGLPPGEEHGSDPGYYYWPGDVARLLDHDWTALINETRPRTVPAPVRTHHTHDTVLRAQRLR